MSRYIDADALILHIAKDVVTLSQEAQDSKEFYMEYISKECHAPTVDLAKKNKVLLAELEYLKDELDRTKLDKNSLLTTVRAYEHIYECQQAKIKYLKDRLEEELKLKEDLNDHRNSN